MKEVMERVLTYTMRKRMLVPVPFPLAKLQGAVLQLLPNPMLTARPGAALQTDNVVSEDAKRDAARSKGSASSTGGGRGRGPGLSRAIPPASGQFSIYRPEPSRQA